MRVAFDARVLNDPGIAGGGIGRYASCLAEALQASHAGELVVFRSLPRPPAPERLREGWEHVLLSRDVRRAGASVVHTPTVDLVSLRPGAASVITLHDLVPLKQPELYLRTGLKHRLRYLAVKRADRVIVAARSVAHDAERLLGLAPEKVDVVPYAPAAAFRPVPDPRSVLARLELPERFLVWVGGMDPPDPRKGVEALAAAVRDGDGLPLVLAGRAGAQARSMAAPGRVHIAGRLSDAELAALMTAADVLVFPSGDEGYGLPPVEALACGTPVAAYAAGSLTETLSDLPGAVLVEAGDLAGLLAAAESLAGTRAPAPPRTWADVAQDTWCVYERAARA
jgi:glycosyltransferase involved in cell wall biosynthesis